MYTYLYIEQDEHEEEQQQQQKSQQAQQHAIPNSRSCRHFRFRAPEVLLNVREGGAKGVKIVG